MRRLLGIVLSLVILAAAGAAYAEENEARAHHVLGSVFGEEGILPAEAEKILEECGLRVSDSEMVPDADTSITGLYFDAGRSISLGYSDKHIFFYWLVSNDDYDALNRSFTELYLRRHELEKYVGGLHIACHDRDGNDIEPADFVADFRAVSLDPDSFIAFDDLIQYYNTYAQMYYEALTAVYIDPPLLLVTDENMEKTSENDFDVIRCRYDFDIVLTIYMVKGTRSVSRIELYAPMDHLNLDLCVGGYNAIMLSALGNHDPLLAERMDAESAWDDAALPEGVSGERYNFHVKYELDTSGDTRTLVYRQKIE